MLKKLSASLYTTVGFCALYLFLPTTLVFAQGSSRLQNPLRDIGTIDDLLVAILNIFIILAIPIIVIFIILAGFKYVTARGNPQQIEEASRALTYAIIGGVLVIGAVAIAEIIRNLINTF